MCVYQLNATHCQIHKYLRADETKQKKYYSIYVALILSNYLLLCVKVNS